MVDLKGDSRWARCVDLLLGNFDPIRRAEVVIDQIDHGCHVRDNGGVRQVSRRESH